jgi:hypothetical protein
MKDQPHTGAPAPSLEESLSALAATIRDAGESLLDLQEALAKLRVATEPTLHDSVHGELDDCLRNAMRD